MSIPFEIINEIKDAPAEHGRSSEVFNFGEGKLLKLYLADYPEEYVDLEYSNTCEVSASGATPMKVYGKVKSGDRYGIILEKLSGIPMTNAPEKNPALLLTAGGILAAEHVKVQKCHSDKLRDVREIACECLDNKDIFSFLCGEEIAAAKAYIRALPGDNTILHLDFHTGNVLIDLKTKKTVTIDWMTAAKGRPECEVAMMQFLFSDAELFPGCSKLQYLFYATVRKSLGKSFMKHYLKSTNVNLDEVAKWRIVALILREGLWNIASERQFLSDQIMRIISKIK